MSLAMVGLTNTLHTGGLSPTLPECRVRGGPRCLVALGCGNSWHYWGQRIRARKGCAVLVKTESGAKAEGVQ